MIAFINTVCLFQFRVWARPSFINDSWYAVEKGPEVLDYYADYFGIPFPLPKQGMQNAYFPRPE